MLTFCHNLYIISAYPCFLSQGVCIDIKPIKGLADDVLIPHLKTMLSVVGHIFGQFDDAVFCLEDIADIYGTELSRESRPPRTSGRTP